MSEAEIRIKIDERLKNAKFKQLYDLGGTEKKRLVGWQVIFFDDENRKCDFIYHAIIPNSSVLGAKTR